MTEPSHIAGEVKTHQRIIEAALQEFTQHGYKGASTRAIAERASVNEVTLFRHFGNKVDLLRIAVEYEVAQVKLPDNVDAFVEMDLREGFSRLIREYLMQLTRKGDILMLGFAESYSHPQIVDSLKGLFWRIRTMLQSYFSIMQESGKMRQADSYVLAQIVIATLHTAPVVRKTAPKEVSDQLTDERLVSSLVETIVTAYEVVKDRP